MSIIHPMLFVLSLSGCALAGMKQMHDNVQASTEQARTNAIAAQAKARSDRFVVADHTWLCPTAQAALAKSRCEGGIEILKNRVVTVIGQAPKDGVWPASHWDALGEHHVFAAADALNELPDTTELDAYTADVAERYPDERRIPLHAMNFADLVTKPRAYQGRFLVVRQRSSDMRNKDFGEGRFTFTIPIPVSTGSRRTALAQFELDHAALVRDFEKGGRTYQCGPTYCDEFVIVAEHTGRTVERVDPRGDIKRLPVFAIRELGDRYGSYRGR